MSCFFRVVATLTFQNLPHVPPWTQGKFLNPIKNFILLFRGGWRVISLRLLLLSFCWVISVKFSCCWLRVKCWLFSHHRSFFFLFCYLLWKVTLFFSLFVVVVEKTAHHIHMETCELKSLYVEILDKVFHECHSWREVLVVFCFHLLSPPEESDGTSIVWRNWKLCRLDMMNFFHFSFVKFFHLVVDFFVKFLLSF